MSVRGGLVHPTKKALRLGAQTGEVEKTLVYLSPSEASLSKLGVFTFLAP